MDEALLSDLLLQWEELRDQGKGIVVEELCHEHPEVLVELRLRVQALLEVDQQLSAPVPSTRPSPPEVATPTVGSLPRSLGRYRVETLLGKGGFGAVWRAFDPELQRPVALKVPRTDAAWSTDRLDVFLSEARKVARLEHEAIVPVYDVGRDGERCFIVSKLIDGVSLAQRLEAGAIPASEAARLVALVAEALHFAHLHGVVHRDVKPANILLDSAGRPYLGDFGLAVTEEEQRAESGGIRGTRPYMPPEQAQGHSHWVDGRADVYSLGVVLYECLAGRLPFTARTWPELREQILEREPRPPRSLNDTIPAALEQICLRCMAKRPSDRYSTAGDLAEALRRWLAAPAAAARSGSAAGWRTLSFSAERSRYRKDFIGRHWLDQELECWLGQPGPPVLLITGDPGAGKSAYLAHVADRYPTRSASHFCIAGLAESLDPVRFVQSLAVQLAEQEEGCRRALEAEPADGAAAADAGTLWRHLIADPLRSRPAGSVLLLVDALDEASATGDSGIVRLLRERLDDLPAAVRLVLSARKDPTLLDRFSAAWVREIAGEAAENRQDLAAYLQARFEEATIAERLREAGVVPKVVAAQLAARSEGNFLYAAQSVAAMRSGRLDPGKPESFPEGLVGVYQREIERLFPAGQGYAELRPLLEVLMAAREPLTAGQLAQFIEIDPFDAELRLERLATLFPCVGGRYRAYHKSITDWLAGLVGRSRTYRVSVRSGHKRLAERLWQQYRTRSLDPFGLSHLAAHLRQAERWADLEILLTDLRYIESRGEAGQTFDLVSDYAMALTGWPGHEPYEPFDPTPPPTEPWLRESVRAVLAGAPAPQPDRGAGRVLAALRQPSLTSPPDESPVPIHQPGQNLTDDMITPDPAIAAVLSRWQRNSAACRAGLDPFRSDTPAARVQAFAGFVTTHAHSLQLYAQETLPLAFNYGSGLPVGDTAAALVPGLRRPWIARDPQPAAPRTRPACFRTLPGHTDIVLDLALSADGRTVVSGGKDQTVRVWDVRSGRCTRTLVGHAGCVRTVRMTPDAQRAVSGGDDGTVRLWDLGSGECLRVLSGHGAAVLALDLTPNGTLAVSAGRDHTLRVWDLERGAVVRRLEGETSTAHAVAVTPDGRLALSAGRGLLIWDVTTGERLRQRSGQLLPGGRVALSANGRVAVSAVREEPLHVWDLASDRLLHRLFGHSNWVLALALSPDGRLAISGARDGSLRLWDLLSGVCVQHFQTSPVFGVALSRDGALAATAHYDQAVRVWDLACGDSPPARDSHQDIVFSFAWAPADGRAVSASRDATLRVWDVTAERCLRTLRGHTDVVHALSLSADGRTAASGGGDQTVRLWNLESGECVRVLEGHHDFVREVALTPDGSRLVSASYDGSVRVWDPSRGDCLQILEHSFRVLCATVSIDGRWMMSGGEVGDKGQVCLWDLATGRLVQSWHEHTSWVTHIALTPNGRLAVSASNDTTLRVWDLAARKCVQVLRGHTDEVLDVSITPDGGLALSASDDNTVRLWDVKAGQCLTVYHAGAEVRSVSPLGPDGRFTCGTAAGQIHRLVARNLL